MSFQQMSGGGDKSRVVIPCSCPGGTGGCHGVAGVV